MLIVIEGIDGSGKSTLAKNLYSHFLNISQEVVLTREPGGSALGKKLREILQTQPVPITPIAEFLLFAADRAQHIHEVVKPALEENKIVISDRMGDSSLVYQGFGRGIDKEEIKRINAWAMQGIKPDITIYVKLSPEQAATRLKDRNALSAFEKEHRNFTQKLAEGFDTIYQNRNDVVILDGMQTPQSITQHALKAIDYAKK